MKTVLFSMLMLFTSIQLFAQKKITEGIIIYTTEWELPAEMESMQAFLPSEIKVYFKGDTSSTKIESQMYSSTSILNARNHFEQLLLDLPLLGKKYVTTLTEEDKKKMSSKMPKIELLRAGTETKIMNGYKAYKYAGIEGKSNQRFDAWFTNDIEIPANSLTHFYDKSYGVPIQFVSYANGISMKVMLKQIKAELIPPRSFMPSTDYEPITLDELMKMSGDK